MELGDLQITLVSDGGFRLDGGAMFGVVPRTLWEKVAPPDEQNRIRMGTNCLLIERGDDLLLIDTGIGDKHEPRFLDNYGLPPGAARPRRSTGARKPRGTTTSRGRSTSRDRSDRLPAPWSGVI